MSNNSTNGQAGFEQVYEQLFPQLLSFMYYKTGDMEQAKDYTQEAFSRYWLNAGKVHQDKVKSYIYTIANRLYLDNVNHQKVKLKFQYRSDLSESHMEFNPEYIYREAEFKDSLELAISNLPEQARIVFLMSRLEKRKNREIAELLNISIKTVEKHLCVSLKKLRNALDELQYLKI